MIFVIGFVAVAVASFVFGTLYGKSLEGSAKKDIALLHATLLKELDALYRGVASDVSDVHDSVDYLHSKLFPKKSKAAK